LSAVQVNPFNSGLKHDGASPLFPFKWGLL
jgi:hypothetical protein